MQLNSINSVSPSFTADSSNNNLADIAARVVEEFRNENDDDDIYNFFDEPDEPNELENNHTKKFKENEEEENDEEDEFEFAVVSTNPNSSPFLADEIFSNGEILPRYPLFDRSLLLNDVVEKPEANSNSKPEKAIRRSLGKLFEQERESVQSVTISSPEAETDNINLDGIAPETYCIWKPKVESPERCKKSKSTGNSSKRWRFKNLLQRSNSDGNMAAGKNVSVSDFVNLTTAKKKGDKTAKVAGADDDGELTPVTDDVKSGNRIYKGGNRIRSYLRYKKEQIGV